MASKSSTGIQYNARTMNGIIDINADSITADNISADNLSAEFIAANNLLEADVDEIITAKWTYVQPPNITNPPLDNDDAVNKLYADTLISNHGLADVLGVSNDAGALSITNLNDVALNTINGSAYPFPVADNTLTEVLTANNDASGLSITNLNDVALSTINGSAYPFPVADNTLTEVLTANNDAGALSITNLSDISFTSGVLLNNMRSNALVGGTRDVFYNHLTNELGQTTTVSPVIDLEYVLIQGNDALGQSIDGVNNINLTTINGSAYPSPSTTLLTTSDNTSGTYYIPFVKTSGTGEKSVFIDDATTPISVNPSTGDLNVVDTLKLTQLQVAIGKGAGTTVSNYATAVGSLSGNSGQATRASAFGNESGKTGQGQSAVAVGDRSGYSYQGSSAVAVGDRAGYSNQGSGSIALGLIAGYSNQGSYSIALGYIAGYSNQGSNGIAIGTSCGTYSQGQLSIAVGNLAGNSSQGIYCTAIGYSAGQSSQGNYSNAFGRMAGQTSQHSNTNVINATGVAMNTNGINRTFIKPIRGMAIGGGAGGLWYDTSTGEIVYSTV